MFRCAALPVILAAAIVSSCNPAVGTECPLEVTSSAELTRAFACAPSGAMIKLASGGYGELRLENRVRGDITLHSADLNNPAMFTSLTIASSTGINLENLQFSGRPRRQPYGLLVVGSQRVRISDSTFTGPGMEGETRPLTAVMLRDSTVVTIRDNRFSSYKHGIALLNVREVVVAGNHFANLRTDGVRGGGASDLLVELNEFSDFHPDPKDHPDGIQLWSTQQTEPARNIIIRNNLIFRGAGAPTQGVFVRDTFGEAPFEDVVITGNIVIGGLFNGITLAGVKRGNISGNTVIPFPDHDSRIRIEAAVDTELTHNAAGRFILRGDIRSLENKVIPPSEAVEDIIRQWRSSQATKPVK